MAGPEETMYAPLIEYLETELKNRGYDDFGVYDTHKGHFPPDLREKFSPETNELISILALEPDICGYYKSELGGYKIFHIEGKWDDIQWNGLYQARHDAELLDTDWAAVVDIVEWKSDMIKQIENEEDVLLTYYRRSDIEANSVKDRKTSMRDIVTGLVMLFTIALTAIFVNVHGAKFSALLLSVLLVQFLSLILLWKPILTPIHSTQDNQYGRSGKMYHAILDRNSSNDPIATLSRRFEPENPFEVFK